MNDEDFLRRPEPLTPYRETSKVLAVPEQGVAATLSLLQQAGQRESGLIWYGERAENGDGHVRYVVAPRQKMSRGNYEIAAEWLAEVVRALPDTWRPLAQVHSHPGRWVEHSRYDDKMAMSRRALSLVIPFYGRYDAGSFPAGVGVHECQDDYWYQLPLDLAQRRLLVAGGEVQVSDFR
jgi:hypothetical protein